MQTVGTNVLNSLVDFGSHTSHFPDSIVGDIQVKLFSGQQLLLLAISSMKIMPLSSTAG
jgi:hypothetical protein